MANLNLYQGDDYIADVTVLNADGSVPDLTGYTAVAQVRSPGSDPTLPPDAVPAILISGNVITLQLAHTQTLALNSPPYRWDLQLTDSMGWVTTVLNGVVTVIRDVSR